MSLTLILMASKMTMMVAILIMTVWVWSRATTATRLFSVGLATMFVSQTFRPQVSQIFLISVDSILWTLVDCIPLIFFVMALYSEFGWRVVSLKKKKK